MGIVFDPKKSEANFKKHGVFLSESEPVFDDPGTLTIEDKSSESEQRFISVGMDSLGRFLTVVWTDTDEEEIYRVISARRSSAGERKSYERNQRRNES